MEAFTRTLLAFLLLTFVSYAKASESIQRFSPVEPIPKEEPQIIKELKAAGIQVTVTPPPESGDPDFNKKLNSFYLLLNSKRKEVLKRKNVFEQLDITYFNHFDSFNKILSLSVNVNDKILENYFKLFDRRINFEKETQIILDLGIETYANNQGLDLMSQALDQIISLKAKLIAKKSLLNRLFLDDFYSYKVSEKFLIVERTYLKQQLENFLDRSFLVSDFVGFANQIGLKVSGDLDFAIRPADFTQVINNLLSVKPELEFLVKTSVLSEVELNFRDGNPAYRSKEKLLEIGNSEVSILSLVKTVKALSLQYAYSISWNKTIDAGFFEELNGDYIGSIERIKKFNELISEKLPFFKKIKFNNRTYLENETLNISISESNIEFERILKQIN